MYIIEDNVSKENIEKFNILAQNYGRKINFISMPLPELFYNDNRFTIAALGHTFCRMALGKLLPKEIDKVLCMDSDMLVLQSLDELWSTDIDNYYVAGVDSAPGIAMMKKTLKIEPGTLYCNGGLFLVNLKKVRNDKKEEDYENYIRCLFNENKSLGAYEEEVINKCCYPQILRLHPKFNLMTVNMVMDYESFIEYRGAVNYYSKMDMEEALKFPVIIHAINTFYIRKRIWEKDSDSPYADKYIMYRQYTPWKDLPLIEIKRTFKQKIMKDIWHIFPPKISFKVASFVRNQIRPLLTKKRDDE